MNTQEVQCPPACPFTIEQVRAIADPPRWTKWLGLLPPIMIVVLPIVGGATAWVSSRVDAANAAQEQEIRRDYVEGKSYESDKKTQDYLREQLDKRLDRIDKKLDELLGRKASR